LSNRQLEHRLHCGRSKKPIVKIIPDSSGLYRVAWPDIGPSDLANLTRCKQAALEWAEKNIVTEQRNLSVAQRLKSLDNFSWSASPVRSNQPQATQATPMLENLNLSARQRAMVDSVADDVPIDRVDEPQGSEAAAL
jgi:hypothetical protein